MWCVQLISKSACTVPHQTGVCRQGIHVARLVKSLLRGPLRCGEASRCWYDGLQLMTMSSFFIVTKCSACVHAEQGLHMRETAYVCFFSRSSLPHVGCLITFLLLMSTCCPGANPAIP